LFADELVALVLGVVVIFEFAGGVDFKIEELVAIGAPVSDAG
jgi:hypothetical protein